MATTVVKQYSSSPYYDDFDETKNYHRILFRPGYAVQARELTQLQTSLQAQIDRYGQYAFKDGSRVVNGKVTLNVEYDFVKIESSFTHSTAGALNADNYLAEFVGTTITGATGGVTAEVLEVVAKGDASNPATLFVKYTSSGTNNTTSVFANGEELTSNGSPVRYAKAVSSAATGYGSTVNIEEGVYFISGTFAYVPGGSLILDKYTNTPNYIVGLKVTETVVESGTDSTLLDNAQGVPNTAAPGANRYQISTTLIKQPLALASRTENDYITLIVIEDGKSAVDKTDKNQDTELTERLARRTFEESGDYVVEPFQLNVREYLNDGTNFGFKTTAEIIADGDAANTGAATTFGEDRLVVGIDPSVAYVKGFRVQNATTKNLTVEKPRSASSTNTVNVATTSAQVGNYVKLTASTVKGMPDVNTFATIDLHNATGQGGSVIGTARARAIEFVSSELRLFLFDIKMTGNNIFSAVRSVNQSGTAQNFIGDLASAGNLFEVGNNTMVFKLPQTAVKTLKTSSTETDTIIVVKQLFDLTSNAISISDGTFINTSSIVASLGTGVIDTTPTISAGSDGATSLTFSDVSGVAPGSARLKVMADVRKNVLQKQKNRVNGATKTGALSSGALSLGKSDIIRVTEVKDVQNVVITDRFIVDNGQRDGFYANGKVTLKPGFPTPTGNITITFDHYTHAAGDYFSVDSYPEADRKKKIVFNSSKGTFNLLDCLDFRPTKADADADNFTGTNASNPQAVKPNSAPIAQVEHYMPRIDKIFITRKGEFKTAVGVPNLNPKAPETPDDAMGIYDLNLKPFIYELDDVKPKILNNTRYTMKDIGALDKRIKTLEYYTSLSLLEQSAADVELFDGSGFSRLKNGFIVDGFRSHTVGDSSNPDYSAAIDKSNGILRPKFDERNVNLVRLSTESNSTSGAATLTNSLATMPMTTDVNYINQPYASTFSNVNPYNVFSWAGTMELSPDSDEWKETDVRPNVVIDDSSSYDQFKQMAEEQGILGTVWNEWETNWTGVETDVQTSGAFGTGIRPWWLDEQFEFAFGTTTTTTTTTTQNQSRTGLSTELAFDTVLRSDGTRVVEVNFVPFIRSRKIFFKAQLMKPSTKVYAYFDGVNVTDFCAETAYVEFATRTGVVTHEGESAANASDNLITNGSGLVEGSFIIPRNAALKFQTGVREFRLTDSITNNKDEETTFAEAQYHAQGLMESVESRIVSTKVPRLVQSELNQDRTVVDTTVSETTEWIDPVAETILIDKAGGIFAKSVDLFFKTISTTIPVRVTIRSTQNGVPTQRIVPGADKIVYPTDIVSDPSTFANATAATATNFAFDYPVYLAQDTEYAIVITSQSDDYEVWIAEMGGFDVTNTSERITKQPYNGVFFTSANASTWTPEQSKDLKFKLNRASFSGSSSTLTLVNDILPPKKLGGNPFVTAQNSNVVTVTHKNHGMYGGGTTTIAGAVDTNGITAAQLNGNRVIANITHDSYTITAGGTATNTTAGIGAGGGSAVTATENRHMDVIYPVISNITLPGTAVRYFLTTYSAKSINGTETAYQAKAEKEILVNKNFTFDAPSLIGSAINESTSMGSAKSFKLRCVLSTTDEAISPVIDLNRASIHTIENIISSSGGSETTSTGGAELSRYITKKVELNEEADSITMFLNVLRPGASNVDLYYRTLEGGSSADINDVTFIAATPSESIPVSESSFSEVRYDLTESVLTAANIGSFGTVQFKIVLRSTSTSNPPLIKDFRAICAT